MRQDQAEGCAAAPCSAIVACLAILQRMGESLPDVTFAVCGVSRTREEWLDAANAELEHGDLREGMKDAWLIMDSIHENEEADAWQNQWANALFDKPNDRTLATQPAPQDSDSK